MIKQICRHNFITPATWAHSPIHPSQQSYSRLFSFHASQTGFPLDEIIFYVPNFLYHNFFELRLIPEKYRLILALQIDKQQDDHLSDDRLVKLFRSFFKRSAACQHGGGMLVKRRLLTPEYQ
jgi:hypothetical protein